MPRDALPSGDEIGYREGAMYLKKLTVKQLKCFDSLEIDFPGENGDYSGWIVLLGGNGTGKSTLLQAMALALLGDVATRDLITPRGYVRQGSDHALVTAEIVAGKADIAVGQPRKTPYTPRLAITSDTDIELSGQTFTAPQVALLNTVDRSGLLRGPYDAKRSGWFACGYGPFRRLSGGAENAALTYSPGRDARMASLFHESVALTKWERWLTSLYSRALDPSLPDRERYSMDLATVHDLVNQLLKGPVQLNTINSKEVLFSGPGGAVVTVPQLSDGYRSFLALVFDILRHLQESIQGLERVVETDSWTGPLALNVEGVVLIDEADAHLHPLWQRRLGRGLREVFPKVQFIVTSHSPFIAQTASDRGLFVLRQGEEGGAVCLTQPERSVKGWRVEQILLSPLFGLAETRDEETEALLASYHALAAKKVWEELSAAEQRELAELEAKLGGRLTGPGDTMADRKREEEMSRYVDETLAGLPKAG
jgi:predicted ATP-binding protein involved in virulence